MRGLLEETIRSFMAEYIRRESLPELWGAARLRFGDARDGRFPELRRVAVAEHFMPGDFLSGATVVVSYFVPFLREVGDSNRGGVESSDLWGVAYRATNAMGAELNLLLAELIRRKGYRAAVPENIGFSRETLTSRWSQRHVAWLCGHGTFGVNNMLITEVGCCGRYFSLVADMPVEFDGVVEGEMCGYKKNGRCLVCVKRCVNGALRADGFDRHLCFEACNRNAVRQEGAEICGKCVAGVPCSYGRL